MKKLILSAFIALAGYSGCYGAAAAAADAMLFSLESSTPLEDTRMPELMARNFVGFPYYDEYFFYLVYGDQLEVRREYSEMNNDLYEPRNIGPEYLQYRDTVKYRSTRRDQPKPVDPHIGKPLRAIEIIGARPLRGDHSYYIDLRPYSLPSKKIKRMAVNKDKTVDIFDSAGNRVKRLTLGQGLLSPAEVEKIRSARSAAAAGAPGDFKAEAARAHYPREALPAAPAGPGAGCVGDLPKAPGGPQ